MIGKTVSHYRIVATLGFGGMSIVYKARDTRLNRFVALKFLLEKFCRNRDFLEQFRQEARTASALNHPGICTIHDVDTHHERPFIVMEYLEGETLRDKLQRRGVTMKEAVTCGILIADVLSQAHAVGIVHRDVNPANLFITLERRVKLLDFGIAKLVSPDGCVGTRFEYSRKGRLTLTGTLNYLSPEQALCRDVDARGDIFSVGVVLYEMLTGRRPFRGHNITSTINRIIKATPEPIRSVAPAVPAAIEAIVNRCLEKRVEQRYQTAEELRDDLKSAAVVSPLDTKYFVKSVSRVVETECRTLSVDTIPEDRSLPAF
jgi:non-specific serine/threonine protein kinase